MHILHLNDSIQNTPPLANVIFFKHMGSYINISMSNVKFCLNIFFCLNKFSNVKFLMMWCIQEIISITARNFTRVVWFSKIQKSETHNHVDLQYFKIIPVFIAFVVCHPISIHCHWVYKWQELKVYFLYKQNAHCCTPTQPGILFTICLLTYPHLRTLFPSVWTQPFFTFPFSHSPSMLLARNHLLSRAVWPTSTAPRGKENTRVLWKNLCYKNQ